jgi:hypothetical protein
MVAVVTPLPSVGAAEEIVLPVPLEVTTTVAPGIGLLPTSIAVMVMVEVVTLSAVIPFVGLATAADKVGLTETWNVTTGCCVMAVPAMVTVMVFTSATVDAMVKVVCPFAPVLAGEVSVLPEPVDAAETVAPEMGLLFASNAVTVMVETETPSEETVVGLATAVEFAALTGPGTKPTVGCAVIVVPAMTMVLVLVPAMVEAIV